MITGIPSLTASKVILFYAGISEPHKESLVYIWTALVLITIHIHIHSPSRPDRPWGPPSLLSNGHPNTDKDCDLLHDSPVLSIRKDTPWQAKPQLSWLQPKSGYEFQRVSKQRRTAWLNISYKVILTMTGVPGAFPRDKAAGAWSWPLTSIWHRG
jgi:hypothetical protein